MNLQPVLEDGEVLLRPLEGQDFEALYQVASDPKVWEQHPHSDRWHREVFEEFFRGAMESRGALVIVHKTTGSVIGATRFYGLDPEARLVIVGFTFLAVCFWGTGLNTRVKKLMLDYAFETVDRVQLHVGEKNRRSQIAVERIGGLVVGEAMISSGSSQPTNNLIFEIKKDEWRLRNL
ncbi:MAG: GNAT family N-acetyltransferase [Fimbriimonadaceae bacterium]|jgi:RimJ/RimL family protein N-acetyltransferase|nr:GNAT family N-acetyltransferase [Fimbriimonadaceae bacterium]